jgi:hypothetical protein
VMTTAKKPSKCPSPERRAGSYSPQKEDRDGGRTLGLVKFRPSGNRFFSTYIGGTSKERQMRPPMPKRAQVARSTFLTAPPSLVFIHMVPWWPTSSQHVLLKISKPCSMTLPFSESRSSWKVKMLKNVFLPKRVKSRK